LQIWDLRTGGIFETVKYDHGVTALQFDSRKIISAAGENGIKVSGTGGNNVWFDQQMLTDKETLNRFTTALRCNIPRCQPMDIFDQWRSCDIWIVILSLVGAMLQ
jgi:hypothetical protein